MSKPDDDGPFWSTQQAAKHLGMSKQKFHRLRRHDPSWLPIAKITGHEQAPKFWFLRDLVQAERRRRDGKTDADALEALAYQMFRDNKSDADVVIALKRPHTEVEHLRQRYNGVDRKWHMTARWVLHFKGLLRSHGREASSLEELFRELADALRKLDLLYAQRLAAMEEPPPSSSAA